MYKLLILLAIFYLTACTEDPSTELSQHDQAIIQGIAASDDVYGATVAISLQASQSQYVFCSGVLIAENIVLTAAHCLIDTPDFPFSQFYESGNIVIIAAENTVLPPKERIFDIERYTIHESYRAEDIRHDLAMIWLKTPVPENIATPIPMLTDPSVVWGMLAKNTPLEFVGYGLNEIDSDGTRLRAEGFVQKYCDANSKSVCAISNSFGQSIVFPNGSMLHSIEKAGPCNGDSGGAVIFEQQGTQMLLGTISSGDENCADYAISTSIPDHYAWIHNLMYPPEIEENDCSALPQVPKRQGPSLTLLALTLLALLSQKRRMTRVL